MSSIGPCPYEYSTPMGTVLARSISQNECLGLKGLLLRI